MNGYLQQHPPGAHINCSHPYSSQGRFPTPVLYSSLHLDSSASFFESTCDSGDLWDQVPSMETGLPLRICSGFKIMNFCLDYSLWSPGLEKWQRLSTEVLSRNELCICSRGACMKGTFNPSPHNHIALRKYLLHWLELKTRLWQ